MLLVLLAGAAAPAYALVIYTSASSDTGGQTVYERQTATGTNDASADIHTTVSGTGAVVNIETTVNGQKRQQTYTKPLASTSAVLSVVTNASSSKAWIFKIFRWEVPFMQGFFTRFFGLFGWH